VVARIQQEAVLLNSLFDKTLPDRLWAFDAARPVEGVAVSGFGVRTILNGRAGGPHNGLDLAAVTGTPIFAPTGGIVVYAREFYYTGNTVVLDHGQGLYSTLAHLSAIDVHEGDRVSKGALVGKVGATGRVTGAHLHWGVRLHGARVDPLSLIDSLTISTTAAR
jgi:murein DD-endopeptidase MepM/ murein hydrolase activator NlpD